jgi:hypothetical protein
MSQLEMKPIEDAPGYFVTRDGRIYNSQSGKLLKVSFVSNKCAYPTAWLATAKVRKQRTVHRIVAETFLGKPPTEKFEVNHIDGNRQNNHLDNLEWVTHAENIQKAVLNGQFGRYAKLDANKVREIRDLLSKGMHELEVAKKFNVSRMTIRLIRLKKTWHYVIEVPA